MKKNFMINGQLFKNSSIGLFLLIIFSFLIGCSHREIKHEQIIAPQLELIKVPEYKVIHDKTLDMREAIQQLASPSASAYQRLTITKDLVVLVEYYAKIQDKENYLRLKQYIIENYNQESFSAMKYIFYNRLLDYFDRAANLIHRINVSKREIGIGNKTSKQAGSKRPLRDLAQHNYDSFVDGIDGLSKDIDNDGIPDSNDIDNDGDGHSDQKEEKKGTDPNDPNSKPEDDPDVKDNEFTESSEFYPCPGCRFPTLVDLLNDIYEIRTLINELTIKYLNITYGPDEVIEPARREIIRLYR